MTFLHGKFGNEDGCLGKESDYHDDSGLHVYIHTHTHEFEGLDDEIGSNESERYAEHDCPGDEEGVVETGKDEVDKEEADGVDEEGVVRTGILCFFACDTCIFVAVGIGHHFATHFLDGTAHIIGSVSGCGHRGNGVGREEVEVVLHGCSHVGGECDELRDGYHLFAYGYEDVVEGSLGHAVFFTCLYHDTIDVAVLHVGTDVGTCDEVADGFEYGTWRYAHALAGYLIDVEFEFRIVLRITGGCKFDFGTLVKTAYEFYSRVDECLTVGTSGEVLQIDTDVGTVTVAGYLWHLEGLDVCLGQVDTCPFSYVFLYVGYAVEGTLAPVAQAHHECGIVGAGHVFHHGIAGECSDGLYLVKREDVFFKLNGGGFGLVEVCSRGEHDVDEEESLIFLWHEVGLGVGHEPCTDCDGGYEDCPGET